MILFLLRILTSAELCLFTGLLYWHCYSGDLYERFKHALIDWASCNLIFACLVAWLAGAAFIFGFL